MHNLKTLYVTDRKKWREWLQKNKDKRKEIWLLYPKKSSGRQRIQYNDAVEEALCFGWIDSTVKTIDKENTAQRFSPRNPQSDYSQSNKERLRWLAKENRLHPSVREAVKDILKETFVFPADILRAVQKNKDTRENYNKFSDSYKRIRIAYIDAARKRPEEFRKRLANFIKKTQENKQIGFGGIEKYY